MTRPWETIASAETRDGRLELRRRGDSDYLITVNGRVLMTSAAHRSEDALAQIACAPFAAKKNARVLVGGLGMGFTLRAALDALGRSAHVTVAELNPVVVDWCRGPLSTLTTAALGDPRVGVLVDDVSRVIARAAEGSGAKRFDAIVIDLYEGPQARIADDDVLYSPTASANVARALRDGGIYAVWCEKASPAFERSLRRAGFQVELTRAGRGGSVHLVYVAKMPPAQRDDRAPRSRPRS
jgi:spermidine synthase